MINVAVDGLVSEATGLGVLQRALYPRLEQRGFELTPLSSRDRGRGGADRLYGLALGLFQPLPKADVYLSIIPPYPTRVTAPAVSFVHDLRWTNTRSILSRLYRAWDLRRTVADSRIIACISTRTQEDLQRYLGDCSVTTEVIPLGAGIVDEAADTPNAGRSVLLVGEGPHKRNELAIEALAMSGGAWFDEIVGVNVSKAVVAAAEERLDQYKLTWHYRLSTDMMRRVYRDAGYFVHLGVNEGFGLPYLEAIASGANVIAIDQPLTREVLSQGAILLDDGTATHLAQQLQSVVSVPWSIRCEVAERYSWDHTADLTADAIRRAYSS